MANNQEAAIESIIARAAAEIAAAVRGQIQTLVTEALRLRQQMPTVVAAPPTKNAVKKLANAQTGAAAGRAPHPGRSYTDADIAKVLAVIKDKPGQRAEQYALLVKIDRKAFGKVLDRLRETGAVKTTGARRAMTYRAA